MSKQNAIEEESLWKTVQKAVDMTIKQGTVCTGFSIEKVLRNLKTITTASEWSREYLFERAAKTFIAIYANQLGKRAGIKGKGVYFDEDSLNQSVAEGLAINEQDLAGRYASKADELSMKVKKNADDGQIAFDDEVEGLYEEKSLEWLTDFIKDLDGENV